MNETPVISTPTPGPSYPIDMEKRKQADRRNRPTSPWGAFRRIARRMRRRRACEHRQPYYVDRFSAGMWLFIIMLMTASIVDAVLTYYLIEAGGDEINPLIDRLLDHGLIAFILGKYVLTVIGLPLLLIFKNFYLFGTRVRVGYTIPLLVALYACLIVYQIALIVKFDIF